jgi:peptidoglycan/LPS O-acetylase OafA/YrhL
MKKVNTIIYALFGAGAILYGLAALLAPASMVSEAAQSFHTRHILREEGAAAIFVGLMAVWCIFNYERRAAVHYALMVFAFLLAAIHWSDYFAGHLPWLSPLYNSVPFLVLAAMAVLGRTSNEKLTQRR